MTTNIFGDIPSNEVLDTFSPEDRDKLDSIEENATGDMTAIEIKNLYESNPDTNAFTTAEKNKLSQLDESLFKGTFASVAQLPTTGVAGSYAYVDDGTTLVQYVWDTLLGEYIAVTGTSTSETPSSVKTKYESNPDTNAFTDNEQSKLAGIEPNATGDISATEVKDLYHSNANVNQFTDGYKSKLDSLDNSDIVHKTGDESISGVKTFNNDIFTVGKVLLSSDKYTREDSVDGEIYELRQHTGQANPGFKITDQSGVARFKYDMNANKIILRGSDGNILRKECCPHIKTTAPTTLDGANSGVLVGDLWLDTNTQKTYVCYSNTNGNAVWGLSSGSSIQGGSLELLFNALANPTTVSGVHYADRAIVNGAKIYFATGNTGRDYNKFHWFDTTNNTFQFGWAFVPSGNSNQSGFVIPFYDAEVLKLLVHYRKDVTPSNLYKTYVCASNGDVLEDLTYFPNDNLGGRTYFGARRITNGFELYYNYDGNGIDPKKYTITTGGSSATSTISMFGGTTIGNELMLGTGVKVSLLDFSYSTVSNNNAGHDGFALSSQFPYFYTELNPSLGSFSIRKNGPVTLTGTGPNNGVASIDKGDIRDAYCSAIAGNKLCMFTDTGAVILNL